MNTAPLRAAGRIAWRSARRNVRRSVLILVMVALPVALVTATATIARTTVSTPEDEIAGTMGTADLFLSPGSRFEPDKLEGRLPDGSEIVTTRYEELSLIQGGALVDATLLEPDAGLDSPILNGLYELVSGRVPREAGEVALHADLLTGFDAQVGDEIEFAGNALIVTGVARAPQDLDHHIAVVGPRTLAADAGISNVLIDLPPGASTASAEKALRGGVGSVSTREELGDIVINDAAVWDAASLVGGALALFATGLIAAAAFVVGARRQLRELGMVGAIGGEPRHVRAVVWLGGTTLGVAGGVLGSVLGVGLAYALHPFLDRLAGRVVGPVDINVLVVIGAILMGTAAATLAALAPARAAGKLSPMEALAGRTPPPLPPGRIAALGFLVVALGGALAAWSTISDRSALLAAGLIAMLVGVLLSIPLLVSLVGKLATRLPMTGRIAARDAARHGRRTGAAVAAAVIALGVPVAVATYSLSEETYERRSPRLGDDQILIVQWKDVAPAAPMDVVVADVKKGFPPALVVPLTHAVAPRKPGRDPSPVTAFGAKEEVAPGSSTITAWELFIADATTLRAIHAEEGAQALVEGKALVLAGYGTNKGYVRVQLPSSQEGRMGKKLPAVAIDSPSYFNESIPRIVISREVAADLGLEEYVGQYLLTAPEPLSSRDIERARDIAADHPGFFVNSAEDYLPKYALARSAATAASMPLALAVLAVAVALVASESRRSHQILIAVGAGPITHRKVVGATSGLLALIAAILAVPAGLLPTIVVQVASQAGRPVVVPWATIAIVVLSTPLVSATVAGLISRSPKLGSLLNPAT